MDGYVTIGTKLDTSGIDKGTQQLEKELELLEGELSNLENKKFSMEDQWQKAREDTKVYREEIANAKAEIASLQGKINEINGIKAEQGWIDPDQQGILEHNQNKIKQIQEDIDVTRQILEKELVSQEKIGFAIDKQEQAIQRKLFAIEKVEGKIVESKVKEDELGKGGFLNLSKNVSKISDKFSVMLKKIGKIALALVGVRTIINLITRSFNTLAEYNTELGTKMEQMRLVLATALEPIINWLVSALHTILSIINQIYSALFSIDLFGRASELWSKKMAKNLSSGAGSAKEMKKQLAGFDEMNVLTDSNASSGGGGGGGSIEPWTLEPIIDWSKFDIHKIMDKAKEIVDGLIKGINDFLHNADPKEIADGISTFIIGTLDIITKIFTELDWQQLGKTFMEVLANLDWAGILKSLVENIIGSLTWPIDLLMGLLDGLIEILDSPDFLKNLVEVGAEFALAILKGLWTLTTKSFELLGKLLELVINILGKILSYAGTILSALIEIIKEWATKAWNFIKGAFQTAWQWVVNLFNTIVQWIANKIMNIYNTFYSIITSIQNVVGNVVNWIKDRFNTFVNFFKGIGVAIGDFFSGAIKGAVNGVLSWVESKVNWFIDKINSVISLINKIPGVSISRLSRISLPRLAVGGIINQPNRGVPVGGIAGESGREGILPLTDQRAMAELGKEIGKWININATIPVNIGNRQVARILEEITADREFAMNS